MAENQISPETAAALDRIDWSSLEVPREVVEANPKVAEQLAAGKATDLVSYTVQIPGIPEPTEKTVQLVARKMKDEETGEWVLDPKVGVREMNEDYRLKRDNLKVVFDNGNSYRLDPEKDKVIIDYLLESRTVTNKESGEQIRQAREQRQSATVRPKRALRSETNPRTGKPRIRPGRSSRI